MKKEAIIYIGVKIPLKFTDREDLEQQVDDLKMELDSLGFEVSGVKCKYLDDEELDEYEDDAVDEEEQYDEDL